MSPRMNRDRSQEIFTPSAQDLNASSFSSSTPGTTLPARTPNKLYFVGPIADFLLIGLGSIMLYVLFMVTLSSSQKENGSAFTTQMMIIAGWLVFACNYPHFAATNYRLYHSKENMMQYPITSMVIPWVILGLLIGSYLSPHVIAPLFIKVYLIWSPYHFSGQTLGISLVYFRRAGIMVDKWTRFTLSSFIYSTFLYSTAKGEVASSVSDISLAPFYVVEQMRIGLPSWVPDLILAWMIISGILFLFFMALKSHKENRLVPLIVMLPALTQFIWFVPGNYLASFNAFVPFFHSLQYLFIAWSMQLKEKMDQQKIEPSVGYVVRETARWGSINLIVGWVLFFALPVFISILGGGTVLKMELLNGFFPWLTLSETNTGIGLQFSIAVFIVAVQLHHFFVDGVIWKLKRKTVSSPLMVNIDELIHKPETARV